MDSTSRALLVDYAHRANHYAELAGETFQSIPGSAMLVRYIRSSYQNDPARSVIELALLLFCLVYLARSRFPTDKDRKGRVVLTEDVSWFPIYRVAH
jgi:serine palmitoyltransferase